MSQSGISTHSFSYTANATHGVGLSGSSNLSVLLAASRVVLSSYPKIQLGKVARLAHEEETILANGQTIAAQDVYPITFGGAQIIKTWPDFLNGRGRKIGNVIREPFSINENLLENHFFITYKEKGKKHNASLLLKNLGEHPRRKKIVAEISAIALNAKSALLAMDLAEIGKCFDRYRRVFDTWSNGKYTSNLDSIIDKARRKLGTNLISWKPPGAGGCDSLALIFRDLETKNEAIKYFKKCGWNVLPIKITGGVNVIKKRKHFVISAGYRFDFVGAADLGQDLRIGQLGLCCSCAIEPRAELNLKF